IPPSPPPPPPPPPPPLLFSFFLSLFLSFPFPPLSFLSSFPSSSLFFFPFFLPFLSSLAPLFLLSPPPSSLFPLLVLPSLSC
ncbi:hypothetical protein ACXWRW_11075, partial [Streptococcus pyogenes]